MTTFAHHQEAPSAPPGTKKRRPKPVLVDPWASLDPIARKAMEHLTAPC